MPQPAGHHGIDTPLRLGTVTLTNRLLLAPMAGVTDRPFRQLCRRMGAGLAITEMVSANTALWGTPQSVRRLDHEGERGPVAVQILGADPAAMAAAARMSADRGAELIDLNMGCPARKVCQTFAGAALLRDERRVARLLEAVVAAVAQPVTLKIRTGWSPEARNAGAIARLAVESGIAALTVHGRTRACGYATPAEYDTLRALREQTPLPLIANGDIDSPEKARFVLDYTQADAIMVGRAARGRPWIFREIAGYLKTGLRPPAPERAWIRDLVLAYARALHEFYGEALGVRLARKHVAWYGRDHRQAARFRREFNQAGTARAQYDQINEFFALDPAQEDQAA